MSSATPMMVSIVDELLVSVTMAAIPLSASIP